MRQPIALPEFPWDELAPIEEQASAHPEGIVKLTVGSPVDPVYPSIQVALSEAAAFSGYPPTIGVPALREEIATTLERRYSMTGITGILPTIGTKEIIAALPRLLGAQSVSYPELAYPTYEIGALLAEAEVVPEGEPADVVFINSPSNPTGRVLSVDELRDIVATARERGAVVASDECYLGLGWTQQPVSILDPRVCDGDHTGLLAIHSLSKSSNLAGYRSGFVVGDADLIAQMTLVRKHSGFMVAYPVQMATIAALRDDEQEAFQKAIYLRRRQLLKPAFEHAGFRIDYSDAGLYLWASRDEDCWDSVRALAALGILVTPGTIYGPAGSTHIRVALTVTDDDAQRAADRLMAL